MIASKNYSREIPGWKLVLMQYSPNCSFRTVAIVWPRKESSDKRSRRRLKHKQRILNVAARKAEGEKSFYYLACNTRMSPLSIRCYLLVARIYNVLHILNATSARSFSSLFIWRDIFGRQWRTSALGSTISMVIEILPDNRWWSENLVKHAMI